jgi:hypothetical protein
MFDLMRMDDFRGFEAYWAMPAGSTTAINGKRVTGPSAELFRALEKALGRLPVVAENLVGDHAGGGGDPPGVRVPRDGDFAVRIWQRRAGAEFPAAQLSV